MRAGWTHVTAGRLEHGWWGPGPAHAPTLVLLHEGLGSVALWRDVPEMLAAATGWGVFAYSRFGYGNSDTTALPRPMSYMHREAQEVLPDVLRAAGIKQAILIGHSDGGSIAAIYAGSDHRGVELRGLVTIAAHFIVEDLNVASIRRIKSDYETGDLRERLARYHSDVEVAFRGWNDAWLDPRFREFDITGFLANIRVPVLAMQGETDPYGTDEQLRVFESSIRAPIKTLLIPGARHAPHIEAKDATIGAIAGFVATLSAHND